MMNQEQLDNSVLRNKMKVDKVINDVMMRFLGDMPSVLAGLTPRQAPPRPPQGQPVPPPQAPPQPEVTDVV